MCEEMLRVYLDHLTVLRVRMPISDDLLARNFVTKITRYEKVVNIPNSMTVLTELLPASLALSERRISGIYNFTNPVRAREPRRVASCRARSRAHALPAATSPGRDLAQRVLELYKKHVDPSFTWKNFTVQEQDLILKVGAGARRARARGGAGDQSVSSELSRGRVAHEGPLLFPHALPGVVQQHARDDKIVGALPDIKINEIHVAMEG